jgi:hypothetical protein
VLLALNAGCVGLQQAQRRAEIQPSPAPATPAQVIAGTPPPAMRAPIQLPGVRTNADHDRAVVLLDRFNDRPLQSQHPRPRTDAYAFLAHAAVLPFNVPACEKRER